MRCISLESQVALTKKGSSSKPSNLPRTELNFKSNKTVQYRRYLTAICSCCASLGSLILIPWARSIWTNCESGIQVELEYVYFCGNWSQISHSEVSCYSFFFENCFYKLTAICACFASLGSLILILWAWISLNRLWVSDTGRAGICLFLWKYKSNF